MNRDRVYDEAAKWLVVVMLSVLLAFAGAWAKMDVYTKDQVDKEIIHVIDRHDRDVSNLKEQTERIDKNVQKLVEKLIEEDR